MKRFVAFFTALIIFTSCFCLPISAENGFIDVPEDKWCYPAVTRAVEKGLFTGTGGNTFSPDEPMTRAMIVTVLAGIAGADLSGYDRQVFGDVPAGKWYTSAVTWASENDLVAGIGGGLFDPKSNITREQFFVMLYKFHKERGSGLRHVYSDYPFDDADDIALWAESAVGYLRMCGVTVGRSKNVFVPDATVSRAEAAAAFVRFTGDYDTPVKDTSSRVMGFSLSKSSSALEYRKSETLTPVFTPANADVKTVRWTSSDPNIVTVSENGVVTAVGEGSATVTATAIDGGFTASCGYTVTAKHVQSVWLNKGSSELVKGQTEILYAGVYPYDSININVTWTSSDPSVIEVNKYGVVTAKRGGSAVVTVRTDDGGLTASCSYTVTWPRGIDPSKPMVALTFDDGPCKNTYRIVDILASYGAVATFFEVGQNVNSYPDAVRYAVAYGNEVGSHSYNHPNLQSLGYSAIRSQVDRTNTAFINAIGYAPTLFRPPYGSRNSSVDSAVGMPMILWSVDTLDWKSRNANSVYNITMNNSRDGSIILMHSLYTSTADALEMILPALIEQGYQFVTVSELAEYRGYTLTGGNRYSSLYWK
ncbi:MAG: polysaccharide deacetylase family protein [Clostridia bacterium]|nr:polysaccharide deacetylase family protein [Clostridia bacterium]